ncbi:MAG TPA: hypothetical protein H9759_07640 [Candidatus Dietzia intestinipullorum]|nr:hypothetical protein [Candidatus Dietzia intestinipullorum]
MPVNTTFGGESAARSRSVALGRVGRAELHRGLSIAATTPGERFLEAYRAARTAAGALLAPGPRRRGPSDVWHRLAAEHPDLGEWATVLRGYSRLAAAVEDGLPRTVDPGMADDFLWAVGRFLDLVDDRLGVLGSVA